MTDTIERALHRLCVQLPGRVSKPGDERYIAATSIWAKPIGALPRAVVHCRTPKDVQTAIRAARDSGLALSVRGGGHDWAGRALCEGLVLDLSSMNGVTVDRKNFTARIAGGARMSNVVGVTDPLGLHDGIHLGWWLWRAHRAFRACA
jgi:FAD/FMN-containing dehydrogenase